MVLVGGAAAADSRQVLNPDSDSQRKASKSVWWSAAVPSRSSADYATTPRCFYKPHPYARAAAEDSRAPRWQDSFLLLSELLTRHEPEMRRSPHARGASLRIRSPDSSS